ncbi:MAG: fibrobacter succinogenes major paralogous domain-containing protein, partial [Ignavibacteria bacterium]
LHKPGTKSLRKMKEKLRNIIIQYGLNTLDDKRKFEAVLSDLLANYDRKEIFVIKTALREGLVHDIKNNGEVRLPVCARKLVEENGIREDIALWAVQVWYYALTGVSADSDIQKPEKHNKTVPSKVPHIKNNVAEVKQPGKDNHGKYKSIKIGSQIWMAKNLNTGRFRNGDIIPEARTNREWEKAGQEGKPAWCYYKNDPANGKKYGRLYNWYAVNDRRGLAPEGWHIPTEAEYQTLITTVNNDGNALKAVGQGDANYGGAGTNVAGPGYRSGNGSFYNLAGYTNDWSSTVYDAAYAYYMYLNTYDSSINRYYDYRSFGFSVRCVED